MLFVSLIYYKISESNSIGIKGFRWTSINILVQWSPSKAHAYRGLKKGSQLKITFTILCIAFY